MIEKDDILNGNEMPTITDGYAVDGDFVNKVAVRYETDVYYDCVDLDDDTNTNQENNYNIVDVHEAFIAGFRSAEAIHGTKNREQNGVQ